MIGEFQEHVKISNKSGVGGSPTGYGLCVGGVLRNNRTFEQFWFFEFDMTILFFVKFFNKSCVSGLWHPTFFIEKGQNTRWI